MSTAPVAAVLIHEAIGDKLTCVFVDHGLLRQGEAEEVVTMFRDNYNVALIHADEQELFLSELEGMSDPETKRKTIGRLFIDVFQKHANDIEGAEFLAQGTLYPDVKLNPFHLAAGHLLPSNPTITWADCPKKWV